MSKFISKSVACAALAALMLAGCGGDSGGTTGGVTPPVVPAPGPMQETINNVFAYINQLITGTDANSEPIDVNRLTLATDDVSPPASLD